MRACLAFPQLMRQYHRLFSSISITPMLLVAESINFEDGLGRKATLQYDFFRQWPVRVLQYVDDQDINSVTELQSISSPPVRGLPW
jgi:hypothetical protein